jgi:hypothetical protein
MIEKRQKYPYALSFYLSLSFTEPGPNRPNPRRRLQGRVQG